MAVAVRRPSGKIIIQEFQWVSISDRFPFLKKPIMRGMAVLIEAMMNGMHALSFSAEQAAVEENAKTSNVKKQEAITKTAIALSIVGALAIGVLMFVIAPHLLTEFLGRILFHGLSVNGFRFHLLDGLIKMIIFIVYVVAISMMPDIKRVFQYHGAEHKSIFTYENKQELAVDNARQQSRFHPRCGTSFILTVILGSILVFSAFFPLLPKPHFHPLVVSLLFALVKIPLMFPIVGLSYEFIRAMGKDSCPRWLRWLNQPGMWMQSLTTREPADDQLEIGLASLKACLWREENIKDKVKKRQSLVEIDTIASPVFEERLANTL